VQLIALLLLSLTNCHALHHAWCLQEGSLVWKQLVALCDISLILVPGRLQGRNSEVAELQQQNSKLQQQLAEVQQRVAELEQQLQEKEVTGRR
jgi:septal ring factor EnvC (AmiA/AmiB activator)